MTTGEILVCIGVIGMAAVIIAAVTAVLLLSGGRKRLRRELDREYGEERRTPD